MRLLLICCEAPTMVCEPKAVLLNEPVSFAEAALL